jgi:hypothetical protein
MSILFWHKTGPRLSYDVTGFLLIEDLNPQRESRWALTRWELHKLGWRMIWASIIGR